jgi:hypothetical protein
MRLDICAGYVDLIEDRLYYRKHKESRCSITYTFHNVVEKRNPYKSKNRRRHPEPTPASLLYPMYNMSYVSRSVKAVCW